MSTRLADRESDAVAEFTDSLMARNLGIARQVIALLKDTFSLNDGDHLSGSPAIATRGNIHLGSGSIWPKIAAEFKLDIEDLLASTVADNAEGDSG